MKTKIIDGFPVKDQCVSCKVYMPISWDNYQIRGNFCSPCNAKYTGKKVKVKEFRKEVVNMFGIDY